MRSRRLFWRAASSLLVAAFLWSGSVAESSEGELLTAAGKPAEGPLGVFLGEPQFDVQVVFDALVIPVSPTKRNQPVHSAGTSQGGRNPRTQEDSAES